VNVTDEGFEIGNNLKMLNRNRWLRDRSSLIIDKMRILERIVSSGRRYKSGRQIQI
jgi:hypothetical protein